MSRAEIMAVISLVVSLCGFALSVYLAFRDRGRIRAESKFFPASEYTYARMAIAIVNEGRRPILLRMLVGTSDDGKWVGEYLGKKKGGLRLGEHERMDINFEKEDAIGMTADEDVVFADLWVEDSLGRRYQVANAKDHLKSLMASPSQSNPPLKPDARKEGPRAA